MPEIDVLYLYEYAARELDVACAVKAIGELHFGLTIHIEQHPYGELFTDLTRFRPRIVAWPQLVSSNIYSVVDWPHAVYVNLMWEQMLYRGNFKAKLPRGDFAIRYAMHHLWGHALVNELKSIGVPSENMFVNGSLAHTLYDEPYRRYFDQRAALARQYRLDPTKRWIFFPENYNWAFYDEAQLDSFVDGGQTRDQVVAMRQFCLRSFDDVIRWCGTVAQSGRVEIIIRPRPGTPLVQFQNAVAQILSPMPAHLHIIKDETVREWIIASDSAVSSYSTSLTEAAAACKPSYILAPYPIPKEIHMEWHDITPHITTQSEFEEVCLNPNDTAVDTRLRNWVRSTVMPHGDAIWGLVDFLARLKRGEATRPPYPPRDSLALAPTFHLPPSLRFEFYKLLRRYQRFQRKLQTHEIRVNATHERELVSRDEITRRVNRWKLVLAEYAGHGPNPSYET